MKKTSLFAATLIFLVPTLSIAQEILLPEKSVTQVEDKGTLSKVKDFFVLPSFKMSDSTQNESNEEGSNESSSVLVEDTIVLEVTPMEKNIDSEPEITLDKGDMDPPKVSLPNPGTDISGGIKLNNAQLFGNAMEKRPTNVIAPQKEKPSFHPESLVLANISLLKKCSSDYNTNVAMINSILNEDDKKATRDMKRSLNECLNTRIEKDTLNYLSSVAAVSLKYSVCPDECSKDDYEYIAATIYDAQDKILDIISERLVSTLKNTCSDDLSEKCAEHAIDIMETHMSIDEVSWAELNEDYRIFNVKNPEVDIITENMEKFSREVKIIQDAVRKEFVNPISGLNIPVDKDIGNDIRRHIEKDVMVYADGSVSLSIFNKPAKIYGQNMFIKLSTDITTEQCKEIVRNARLLGVRQMFINEQNVAIALDPNIYYCSSDNKNALTLVY